MPANRFLLAGFLSFALAACSDAAAPDAAKAPEVDAAWSRGVPEVTLMTQNLYIGTDVDAVLLALMTPDPNDDLDALLTAIATLERTDFPTRAAELARIIRNTRPHAVGLQEVSIVEIVLPPFGLNVQIDFLPILLEALADKGLEYEVAAQVLNIDAQPAPGVRQVDYDVLLVDAERVKVNSAAGHTFGKNVGPFAPGVTLIRGWVEANVTIGNRTFTVVSTHPEPDLGTASFAELRALQVGEITDSVADEVPVVIMGDLNDVRGSPMYRTLRGEGFTDVWRALRPDLPGLTCCHAPDLSDAVPTFTERIDYIFTRGFDRGRRDVAGDVRRVGINPSRRPEGPLGEIWISDHAGLLATLRLPPRGGQ
ncbi:MAG TPA: endonuclease/exonuclease/phosphatase family protein [Gemmatimonadales bacterium]|nr:endonuclease/exonuclease/phosphatase family protein [Gemmatimonadales bacterium]